MGFIKLIVVVAMVGFGYQYWTKNYKDKGAATTASASGSSQSTRGFVPLQTADGANANAVMVVAAENCPEDAAQRADSIASELGRKGIPVVRAHRVSFTANGPSDAQRITTIMNGELPIVLVRGKAKSNPTIDEVIAEYRGQ